MATVQKSILTDFGDEYEPSQFYRECKDSLTKFLYTSVEDDTVTIHLSSALDAGETTTLNNLISNHNAPAVGYSKGELMDSVPGFCGAEISRNTCNYASNNFDDTDFYETASITANVWTPISSYDSSSVVGNQVTYSNGVFTIKQRGLYWYSLYASCQVEGKKEAMIELGLKINGVNPSDGDSKTLCGSDIKTDKHLVSMSGSTAIICEEDDTIEVVTRYIMPSGSNKIRIPILRFSIVKM